MTPPYIYWLIVLAVIGDQATTFLGIKKKEKETNNNERALAEESNPNARAIFKKYGNLGHLIMGVIEGAGLVISAWVFDIVYPGAPFFFFGLIIGVPFNNLYQTYIDLNSVALNKIVKLVFVSFVLATIMLFIWFGLSQELAKIFAGGAVIFLIVSRFYKKLSEFLPHFNADT